MLHVEAVERLAAAALDGDDESPKREAENVEQRLGAPPLLEVRHHLLVAIEARVRVHMVRDDVLVHPSEGVVREGQVHGQRLGSASRPHVQAVVREGTEPRRGESECGVARPRVAGRRREHAPREERHVRGEGGPEERRVLGVRLLVRVRG